MMLTKPEVEIITNKLMNWPIEMKIPVIDLVRVFFLHFSSEDLFSGYDKGLAFLATIIKLLTVSDKEVLKTLTLKALTNLF